MLKLPEAVRDAVDAGMIAPSTAYEISRVVGTEEQEALAARVVDSEMTRAEVAAIVQAKRPEKEKEKKPRPYRRTFVFEKVRIEISHPDPDVTESMVTAGSGSGWRSSRPKPGALATSPDSPPPDRGPAEGGAVPRAR